MKVSIDELRKKLSPSALSVWMVFLEAADDDGVAVVPKNDISDKTGLTTRQVKRALERLGRIGLVQAKGKRGWSKDVRGALLKKDAIVPEETVELLRLRRDRSEKQDEDDCEDRSEKTDPQTSPIEKPSSPISQMGLDETSPSKSATSPISQMGLDATDPPEIGGASLAVGGVDEKVSPPYGGTTVAGAREDTGARASHQSGNSLSSGCFISLLRKEKTMPARLGSGGHALPRGRILGGSGKVRSLLNILALDFVPTNRLPNGKLAELAVRVPDPPSALGHRWVTDRDILDYVVVLWSEMYEHVFQVTDHRMRGVARARGGKIRAGVLDWWDACGSASKNEVKPAEWMFWEMTGWRDRHPPSKQAPIPAMLSAKRVRDGKVRRFFRISARHLGGEVIHDAAGIDYARRSAALRQKLTALIVESLGQATDDEIRGVVMTIFPKGPENAAKVLMDIHSRCVTQMADLKNLADKGHFIWTPGQ